MSRKLPPLLLVAGCVSGCFYYYAMKRKRLEDQSESCIYLDYNGTTPIYPDVLDAMMPYLTEHFGNPSSGHKFGAAPRKAIDEGRQRILSLLGSSEPISCIWFTGCGTESDNLAIQLAMQSSSAKKKHIVTSNVEHPAVELYLKHLEKECLATVTYVPVDTEGRVSHTDVIDALTPDTVLVTLMLANNESGALQPVKEVAMECRKRGILIHTDAAQAAGKVSCQIEDLGYPDLISVVGHKLGAPKGIAALYVRPGCLEENGRKLNHDHGILLIGGGQEFGRRGGTENTPYIVGFGLAAEKARLGLKQNAGHMESLRSRLLLKLREGLGADKVRVNGPKDRSLRLPNTLSIGFEKIQSGDLLATIGHLVAASAGASCHSTGSISSILTAMQVPETFARGTVRLSLGPKTKAKDVDDAVTIIVDAVRNQWAGTEIAPSQ
eukprot:scaffold12116_cov125-Cylindrotheca_fusiformis.AAC.8